MRHRQVWDTFAKRLCALLEAVKYQIAFLGLVAILAGCASNGSVNAVSTSTMKTIHAQSQTKSSAGHF